MKRTAIQLGTVVINIGLCVAISAAQTPSGSAPRSSEPAAPLAVSGCLLQISASSAQGEQFILENARRTSASASSDAREPATPGSGGISGTAGSGATPQTDTADATPNNARRAATVSTGGAERYLVTGLNSDELRKHVNHHVELRGSLEKRHSSDRGTAAASGERLDGSAGRAGTSSSGATSGLGSVAGSSGSTGTPGAPTPSGASTASGTSTTGATSGLGGAAASSASESAPGSEASSHLATKKSADAPVRSGAIGDSPRFRATSLRMISGECTSSRTPE